MYSKVKLLRQYGARRTDREIASDEGSIGHLAMAGHGASYQLLLYAQGDDSHQVPMVPVLFDAKMISMHGARMMFRGFERAGDQVDPNGVSYHSRMGRRSHGGPAASEMTGADGVLR